MSTLYTMVAPCFFGTESTLKNVGAVIDRPRASNARPYKITGTSIRKDTYVYTLYHGRALLFRHGVDAEF